jgi:hypothetical protein
MFLVACFAAGHDIMVSWWRGKMGTCDVDGWRKHGDNCRYFLEISTICCALIPGALDATM